MFRRLTGAALAALLLVGSFAVTGTAATDVAAVPDPVAALKQRPPQDDIIYLIMTDRFFDGDKSNDIDVNSGDPQAYHGGDLQGVIDKLDYIQSLGVTAIWITPVVQNQDRGYHGYWATDFEKVDQHLGTLATLQNLVKQAHQRGIKVLLDVVVNHTGPQHPWVNDPTKQDWFHQVGPITDWNDQKDIEQGQLFDLPDLAQENPAVTEYLLNVDKRWITDTDVDGFRLDTVRHVPKTFWQRFAQDMHLTKPGFFLMGEAWNSDPAYIAGYQATGLDSLLDFPRQQAIQGVFISGNSPGLLNDLQAEEDKVFPDSSKVTTFIDNHDMARFVTQAGDNAELKLRAALAYLLTAKGIPVLYYGTEVAMAGGSDPDNRHDMTFGSNPAMTAYLQSLTTLRHDQAALRRGAYVPIDADPASWVLAYARVPALATGKTAAGKPVVVAINTGVEPQHVTLTLPADVHLTGGSLTDALGATHQQFVLKRGSDRAVYTVTLDLAPFQAAVLLPSSRTLPEAPTGLALAALLLAAVGLAWYAQRRGVRQAARGIR
ncbi:MAG: alpha-amylase family glycosyl hydrolase [Symbiobacteriia bacterium]